MARILILGAPGEVEARPSMSMLNNLLAAGKSIRHDCGGKALCGTCAVRIVEGAGGLSPATATEAARLEASGRSGPWRLACQARVARDVRIEIPSVKLEDGG